MAEGTGDWRVLDAGRDWAKAKWFQEEWRLFLYSLRNNEHHPTCALVRNGLTRRSFLRYDEATESWYLIVQVREAKDARWSEAEFR